MSAADTKPQEGTPAAAPAASADGKGEAGFVAYDFDLDAAWRRIEEGIYVEPEQQKQYWSILLKKKRKYYKQNIDPTYEPPNGDWAASSRIPSPSPSPSTSSSSSSSTSSSSSSSSSSTSSAGSSSNVRYTYPSAPTPPARGPSPGWHKYVQLSGHGAVLVHVVLFAVPLLGVDFQATAYSRALQLAIFLNLFFIFKTYGRPRFSREYAQQAMMDEKGQLAMLACVLLGARPILVGVLPSAMRSTLTLCQWLHKNANLVPSFLRAHIAKVVSAEHQLKTWCGSLEMVTGFLFIFQVFTGYQSILTVFLYWQTLRMRYMLSPYLRTAFSALRTTTDRLMLGPGTYAPAIVGRLYSKLVSLLSNLVDPAVQAQAEQSASRCSIM